MMRAMALVSAPMMATPAAAYAPISSGVIGYLFLGDKTVVVHHALWVHYAFVGAPAGREHLGQADVLGCHVSSYTFG
jgi:hypothetical protein